jgi:hypothetical protein
MSLKESKLIYRYEQPLESVLFSQLLCYNDSFIELLLPHLKPEYFHRLPTQIVFHLLSQYMEREDLAPTLEQAQAVLQKAGEELVRLYEKPGPEQDFHWLKNKVEEFVRLRAFDIATTKAEFARRYLQDPRPHLKAAEDALDFTIQQTTSWKDRVEVKFHSERLQYQVGLFLEDCCQITDDEEDMVPVRDLYSAFARWYEQQDEDGMGLVIKPQFTAVMRLLGFVRRRKPNPETGVECKHWLGIQMKSEWEPSVKLVGSMETMSEVVQ